MTTRQTAETILGPSLPLQRPYELALRMAFDLLRRERPSDEKLRALGAVRQDGMICIPALHERLLIDPDSQDVFVVGADNGARRIRAGHAWALVALHHL
ncbi:MAG: hypothetical protein Q7N50_11785, partial [Armatimonadota bacterium]|nr:hypothetical protein [Armatimonadota bacterium]